MGAEVAKLRCGWKDRGEAGQAELPRGSQALMSGWEWGSSLSKRGQIRFVLFKKSRMAEEQLEQRSRKWAGPARSRPFCGETMGWKEGPPW